MTLDELDHTLPNGFHDAEIFSLEIDYAARTAQFQMALLIGLSDDPEPERQAYQKATLLISGLCFCSVEPPYTTYPFLRGGSIWVGGDPAKSDHLPTLSALMEKCPEGTWCYRFFVVDWNAFIHIAAREAELKWIGAKPKHAL